MVKQPHTTKVGVTSMSKTRVIQSLLINDAYEKPNFESYVNARETSPGDAANVNFMNLKQAGIGYTRTSPKDRGQLNLRIKCSKAFPTNEIAVIEDMVMKVKECQQERERRFKANPEDEG